jgi:hypothetical protein
MIRTQRNQSAHVIGYAGLWCLMPLQTIFQLYRGIYWIYTTSTSSIKVCFCPQKRMSPPVPQTVVIGKKSIWVTNKIKLQ